MGREGTGEKGGAGERGGRGGQFNEDGLLLGVWVGVKWGDASFSSHQSVTHYVEHN